MAVVLCALLLQGTPYVPELPRAEHFLDQQEEPGFFEQVGDTLWTVGKTFVLDMGYLATAPLRPTPEGFFQFVGGVALVGVTMAVLDDPVRGFAQRNRHENLDDVLGIAQNATSQPLETGAALTALGLLFGDSRLQRTGLEVMETEVVVGALAGLGKRLFGRSRPRTERGPHSFKFWGGTTQDRRSLPSDSVTRAFAIAVPIAEEFPGTVWPYIVYGLAGLTAVQRIVVDEHWLSDVLTSALLTIAVGKALVWLHQQAAHPPLIPWLARHDGEPVYGLAFDARF